MLDPALNFPHAEYENHGISMRNQLIYRLEPGWSSIGWSSVDWSPAGALSKGFATICFSIKRFLQNLSATKRLTHKMFPS